MAKTKYWCQRGLMISVAGPGGRTQRRFEQPFVRIGSHADADISLQDPGIARRSLYLHATDLGIFCHPLHGPVEAEGHGWLSPDHALRLGPYELHACYLDGSEPAVPDVAALDQRDSPDVSIPVIAIAYQGRQISRTRLHRSLTILGRSQPSTLRVKHRQISACHCALYWDSSSLWVVDLLSKSGLSWQDASCQSVRLPLWSQIELGRFQLTFVKRSARSSRSSQGQRWKRPVSEDHGSEVVAGTDRARDLELREQQLAQRAEALDKQAESLSVERQALEAEKAEWAERQRHVAEKLLKKYRAFRRRRADLLRDAADLAERRDALLHDGSVAPMPNRDSGDL